MSKSEHATTAPSPLAAWLRLFRLPNVFTAAADVLMGYLFTHALAPGEHLPADFWLLVGASVSLYTAGMVLNDVYDFEADAEERPERPLPAGQIDLAVARGVGFGLLAAGMGLGGLAAIVTGGFRPAAVAVVLAVAVLLYDRTLKRTPLAPLSMGACRMLNVLLGMSAASVAWHAVHWLVALGIGVYIAGVTWFARTEARVSNRLQLGLAAGVMLGGMGLLAWFPWWADERLALVSWPKFVEPQRWLAMWGIVALVTAARAASAVVEPIPARVQISVRNFLFTLIVLDALGTFAVRGMGWAVVVLLLLLPTMFLGRWLYST